MSASTHAGLIAFAPNDWFGQWVNRQQLLTRLAVRRPVVYTNGAWFPWDRDSNEMRSASWRGGFVRDHGVWVDRPPRSLVRWPRVSGYDRLVVRASAARLRRQLAAAGSGRPIAYVFHPAFAAYAQALDARWMIYHAYDRFEAQPGWTPLLDAAERVLLERANQVIASSAAIASALAAKTARPVRVLGNGADVAGFAAGAAAPEPDDLAAIPRPRVGHLGSLHPQIDFGLIAACAAARPGQHWVLIGPWQRESALAGNEHLAACRSLANVHFLGARSHDSMPAYAAHMDVNVMVYRQDGDGWTHAGYPLKAHEYLAAGTPVVSVPQRMLAEFEAVIRFAATPLQWLAALDDALAGRGAGSVASRQAVAAEHSWDRRAAELDGVIERVVAGEASSAAAQLARKAG